MEPRRFEVRTAAVQSQSLVIARVRPRIESIEFLPLEAFVSIRRCCMGSCTPGVSERQRTPRLSLFYLFSSRFRGAPQDPPLRAAN
jgi:hypothetical protein